ncbi:MAG: hypothetical protein N2B05_02470, partial [Gemmatimonadales bacterium]
MNDMRPSTLALFFLAPLLLVAACDAPDEGGDAGDASSIPAEYSLPDPSGWGTQVLAVAVAPDGAVWV